MRKNEDERRRKAEEVIGKSPKAKEDICRIINSAMNGKIDGKAGVVNIDSCKKMEINNKKFIFIQFAKGGHVAVVGAGKDYVKKPLYCGRSSTARIMEYMRNLGRENCNENFQFDVDSIITITINDIEAIGYNKASHILKCRNGVEQYIGELLEENKVQIINYYQHKNFTKSIKELISEEI